MMSIIGNTMNRFGERLKELRIQKGLSQVELAKELRLNPITYLHYEKAQRQPPFEIVIEIADYFDVSLDYLFGRKNY